MGSTTTVSGLITVPGDDDVQLQDLLNWALTISWCSNAIIDVFYDDLIQDPSTTLVLNAGELTTPPAAGSNTDYWYYTDSFPILSGIETFDKTTFGLDATTYGLGEISAETTYDAGANWFKWYDTAQIGSGADYPDGYLNMSSLEKSNADYTTGQEAQVRVKIHTDASGFGGYCNYVAVLIDPDLFATP